MEGLEPVLSSVSDLRIKGSFGAEFGAASANRNRDRAANTEDYHSFNISHIRLGAEASVYEDFHFDTVLSLLPNGNIIHDLGGEGAGANLYHATLTYTGLDYVDLSVGYAFPRFGMEAYAADEGLVTITRSALTSTLRPAQHTGLAAHGEWDIVDYHVGVYNSDAGGGANASGVYPVSYLFNVSGGVDLDEYVQALHEDLTLDLRADFIYNDEAGGFGPAGEPYKNAFAVGANTTFMGFDITYEYLWARATNVAGFAGRPQVRGYYIMPTYYVTDNFQAVARYERIRNTEGSAGNMLLGHNVYAADISGIAGAGNKYQAVYLGGNYYMNDDRVKLMGGVELAELRDTVGANFQSRTHTAMTAVRMHF